MRNFNCWFFSTKCWFGRKLPLRVRPRSIPRPVPSIQKKSKYLFIFVPLIKFVPVDLSLVASQSITKSPLHLHSHNDDKTKRFRYVEFISKGISVFIDSVSIVIRAFRLGLTFFPILIIYPICSMRDEWRLSWYNLVVKALEISGPVYLKFGQWASTRRDIFPPELCKRMEKLQTRTSPHPWKYTEKELVKVFGSRWNETFIKIDNNHEPIGSGCVAQVYKAWIKYDEAETIKSDGWLSREFPQIDKRKTCNAIVPVALKVLHPGIEEAFERDLVLMKFAASFLSWIFPGLKWINLNGCLEEFSEVMMAQIDMRVEAENLKKFGRNFAHVSHVRFPKPFSHLVHRSILVETFEEGESVVKYIHEIPNAAGDAEDEKKKQLLAKLGARTLLKMVFIDNFVHGDLHPGNILVREETNATVQDDNFTELDSYRTNDPFSSFNDLILADRFFDPPTRHPKKMDSSDLRLIILDCGIVSLLRREKLCQLFRDTFRAIVSGQGEKVGDLFLETSEHECQNTQEFRRGMDHIVQSARKQSITLAKIDVADLMQQVFNLLIEHHVRLESEFTAVMLAVMILEGLGRSLDPGLDLLQEAKPFLWAGT